ncbi:MAG: CAP domain-containing protein [Richelia sp. RM2_1_2]|uniref:CAP domain-containing protein n=1 Tax=Plectonema cf. radiosum LEGE 06105 TaxID=945769 RepID=A0A8J7JT66_9CYAN|nr:CAP domain-containing protein [Plectonema radiosum]MBE9213359.1 CAP domain-containing protein [Plectonema cf. radiosum LEGE 06105]NJN13686.1 CAP domain-containing protein [Richelia sp. RM1_1_1]NJO63731.1 CAP domain-containing protein [Richelia sp. RM2_1_2]
MDLVQQVIALTNQERANHGLGALEWNEQLFKAAQGHSQNMAHGDFFEHGDPVKRAREEGYPSSFVGENIAAGRPTPEAVMQQWLNSPGHRNNILSPDYTEIGVGHCYLENDPGRLQYKHYWTQVFGKR